MDDRNARRVLVALFLQDLAARVAAGDVQAFNVKWDGGDAVDAVVGQSSSIEFVMGSFEISDDEPIDVVITEKGRKALKEGGF